MKDSVKFSIKKNTLCVVCISMFMEELRLKRPDLIDKNHQVLNEEEFKNILEFHSERLTKDVLVLSSFTGNFQLCQQHLHEMYRWGNAELLKHKLKDIRLQSPRRKRTGKVHGTS